MGEPATPRPTLASVAALAGVSPSTASLAFSGTGPVSEATRRKVLAAAAQLSYAGPDPRARSLRQGRSGIIGVVIEDSIKDAFRDPITIALLDGIAGEVSALGASLLLITETGDASGGVESAPVDAVVLLGCSTRVVSSVFALQQRGIPIVALEAEHMPGVVAVDLDNRESSRAMAARLRTLGHRDVAVVTLPLDAPHTHGFVSREVESGATGFVAVERLAGVREVFPEARVWAARGSFIEEGVEAGKALLGGRRPTAIIAQSDLLAVGILRAADELGVAIPGDLSVVGYDGIELDGLTDHVLATARQPVVERGRAAGRAILSLLAGEPTPDTSFTSELIEGTTVTVPNQG